jgi:hypothetical protein
MYAKSQLEMVSKQEIRKVYMYEEEIRKSHIKKREIVIDEV